jgi:hypothetical protein
MQLADSSHLGDIRRDTAVRLLAERAILTRALCRELADSQGRFADRRPCAALGFVLRWIGENQPECLQYRAAAGNLCTREPRPSDGLDRMVVPAGSESLLQEIRAGAAVGDALAMLLTADNAVQSSGDEAAIRDRLTAYWTLHAAPVRAPTTAECWSGL